MTDLDPELLCSIRVRAKRQIRASMRALRAAIPAPALAERSQSVCDRILGSSWFEAAGSIALFWPMLGRNEVDLRAVDARARAQNKQVFYPFLAKDVDVTRTGFRRVHEVSLLIDRGRGFCEPPEQALDARPGEIDVVIVPALAVSPRGERIGYGAGFYDATLPEFCPPARSVVVAFDFQLLGELPVSADDVSCDVVITDKRTFETATGSIAPS